MPSLLTAAHMVYARTFHFGLDTSKFFSWLNSIDGGDLYWYLSQGKEQNEFLGDPMDALNDFLF